jgi:NADH dehydrogenase/NADH:ubiquinone oxidoreductase subunit G
LKDFLNSLNCFNYEFRKNNNLQIPSNFRTDFLFNTQIEPVEDADLILMVGVNTRTEAPVLNSRILKSKHKRNPKVYTIGTPVDLTYEYEHLGATAKILE